MWSKVPTGYDLSGEPWGGLGQQGVWGPGHPILQEALTFYLVS